MNWEYVNYLDTGNITENKVDNVQLIDLKSDKLPTRARRIPQKNSILYSTVRPNQKHYGFVRENNISNLLVSTGFIVLDVDKNKADPKYIYYYLIQDSIINMLQNIGETSTSTYPSVKVSDLENLKINLPTIFEQEKIAKILSSFDNKIENNNSIIANLEKQAQAIFKSWFVDFEPFKDSQFINSSMGKIPITCKVSKLKNLSTSVFNGGTPRRNNEDYWINGKIPWLKTKEINNNFIIETEEYITDKGLNESSAKLIRDRSVVVALYGATAGELGFIGKDMTANQACCAIESDYQSYIYYYLKNNQSYIKTLATGSAQQNLSKSTLENLDVLYPEQDYLDRFEKMARSFIEKSIYLELENKKLEKTRDTLLPKLMSGEIRVEEAIEVEEM